MVFFREVHPGSEMASQNYQNNKAKLERKLSDHGESWRFEIAVRCVRPHALPGAATGLVAYFRCGLWGWLANAHSSRGTGVQTNTKSAKAGEKTRDDDNNKKGRRGGEVRSALLLREGGTEKRLVSACSSSGPCAGRHGRCGAIAATPIANGSIIPPSERRRIRARNALDGRRPRPLDSHLERSR